jgi:hypothetical protein
MHSKSDAGDTQTHRHDADRTYLLLFLHDKESNLKNWIGGYGQDSFGSGYGPMERSYEHV